MTSHSIITNKQSRLLETNLDSGESDQRQTLPNDTMIRYIYISPAKLKEIQARERAVNEARDEAFRAREASKTLAEIRRGHKHVYRRQNGLVSLHKTPEDLVSVVRNNSTSPLLRLPAEIRTLIWEYTLGGMRILKSASYGASFHPLGSNDPQDVKFDIDIQLALIRVCRQVYNETATLTFSLNLFCFFGREALEDMWIHLKPAQRHAVKRMVVDRPLMRYYLYPRNKLARLFPNPCAAFPNLQTMVIEPRSWEDEEEWLVKQFQEMVAEVSVLSNLKVEITGYPKVLGSDRHPGYH